MPRILGIVMAGGRRDRLPPLARARRAAAVHRDSSGIVVVPRGEALGPRPQVG